MTKEKKETKKHIKMYVTDEWLEKIKKEAKSANVTQSFYVFSIVMAKINRNK